MNPTARDETRRALGVRLPATYREFLTVGGRQLGGFLTGTDYLQRHIATLRRQAERLLHENGDGFKLLPTHFVFLCHQGYQFMFFECREGPDPSVWHYVEPGSEPKRAFETFTGWFDAAARDELGAHQ